jgi:hypothetical protein
MNPISFLSSCVLGLVSKFSSLRFPVNYSIFLNGALSEHVRLEFNKEKTKLIKV